MSDELIAIFIITRFWDFTRLSRFNLTKSDNWTLSGKSL